jgi:aminoglycoside 2''-phosphotransferase
MTEVTPELPRETASKIADTLSLQAASTTDSWPPTFVSKMHMHSQNTAEGIVENERAMILAQPDVTEDDDIIYDDEGWDSRVFVVNGGAICYKFPRSAEVMAGYDKEIKALNMVNALNVGIKTQRFKSLDPNGRYFSYYGLIGTQLSEMLPSIDISEKQRIGSKIGAFLKVLHSSELEGAPVVTVTDEAQEYAAKYELARPLLETTFTASQQATIAEFFYDRMPDEMHRLGGEIRLCHGDLGSYNIIIDNAGVPGVIDFGNLGYYERSKDFIDFGDDDLLEAVYAAYGDSALLRAKAKVRMLALPAIDLVYYMGKNDTHGIDVTMARLRDSLDAMRHGHAEVS